VFRPHFPSIKGAQPRDLPERAEQQAWDKNFQSDSAQTPRDVICCGMYRACSTWQYEVVAHLVEHYLDGQRLGYLTGAQYAEVAQSVASSATGTGAASAGWRVVKSHEGDQSFARALAKGRAIAVYAYRDVREVAFSLMHKRGMTFEQLLRQGMVHQILANDRFWMAQPYVLVQRYEDVLAHPAAGVRELANHIGISLDDSDAARIADEYSQESNKARTEALKKRLVMAGVDLECAANAQICDANTLLHWNHIRHGSQRSWLELATPRHKDVLHRLCGRWLAARGYLVEKELTRTSKLIMREYVRDEFDLIVARATLVMRSASQQFPRVVRTIKRMFGLQIDAHVGATSWADSASIGQPVGHARGPHFPIGATTTRDQQELASRESHIA
jgi:hypothetical protein